MGMNMRRRQKKLARQRAKQKAERRALAHRESGGLPARFQAAASAPVLHCWASRDVWRQGIGYVLLSRQLGGGNVAFVVFLLDVYCLGVKNVIMDVLPRASYEENLHEKMTKQFRVDLMEPECCRKLVEGAVQYAADLGLPPHPDYRVAKLLFGSIPAENCTRQFVYGKEGKPLFMPGPFDDGARRQQVLHALDEHCGPDGYHYVLGPGLSMIAAGDWDESEEWEDSGEWEE
jgi:hypothetical protein